jgi:hypothetical protein
VALEPAKACIQGLEADDAVGDVGTALADKPRKLGGRVGTVAGVAPTRDLAGVPKGDIEPAQVDQEAQVLDVRLAVVAIVVVPP